MATQLTTKQFIEILLDDEITQPDDLKIFKYIFSCDNHQACASEVGRHMGIGKTRPASPINLEIGRLAKRISKKYDIDLTVRESRKYKYWDLFFDGHSEGGFIWKLKPNLLKALEETSTKVSFDNNRDTFLFAWNPDNWAWKELDENIDELQKAGQVTTRWSCKSHKKVRVGDRAFLVKLGKLSPEGVMASGTVVSKPFSTPHWGDENKNAWRVNIQWDTILNPNKDSILKINELDPIQDWTPRGSGISIKADAAEDLEEKWSEFIARNSSHLLITPEVFREGDRKEVLQSRYERNPYARRICLEIHGATCHICGFDFHKKYGKLGIDFIQVHHRTPLSEGNSVRKTDPKKDLIPVCPNCHAMLHRKKPPLSPDELRSIIEKPFE